MEGKGVEGKGAEGKRYLRNIGRASKSEVARVSSVTGNDQAPLPLGVVLVHL
jgi:hypothetical protein